MYRYLQTSTRYTALDTAPAAVPGVWPVPPVWQTLEPGLGTPGAVETGNRGEDEELWHTYTINPLPRWHLTKISLLLGGVILAREPLAGEGVLVVADPGAALQWQSAQRAVCWGHTSPDCPSPCQTSCSRTCAWASRTASPNVDIICRYM